MQTSPQSFHNNLYKISLLNSEFSRIMKIYKKKKRHDSERELLSRVAETKTMTKTTLPPVEETRDETEHAMKIQALRDMVNNAEKTIQSAKAMLLQIEGKKKTGRPRKLDLDSTEGTIVEGTFDGQIMMGTDGKQYPVPANYASKSKLVEGDMLKLTITDNGTFLYKQVGPIERRHALGVVVQDEGGNYYVVANSKPFRVLLASITYFKATPGDEVAVVLPRDLESSWAAIENVIQKGTHKNWEADLAKATEESSAINNWKRDLKDEAATSQARMNTETPTAPSLQGGSPLDAWVRDMEEIEKEINNQK